jgi:hypothetical protein
MQVEVFVEMYAPQTKILEGFMLPQTKIWEGGTKDAIRIFDILFNGS